MPSLNELLYGIRRIAEHREKLTNKKIDKMYKQLIKDIDRFLSDTYKKYADTDGRLYIQYLDSINKRAAFLNEISDNAYHLSSDVKDMINEYIDKTYNKSYSEMNKAFFSAEKKGRFADAVKDINVQPNVLSSAMQNSISKLKLAPALEKYRTSIVYQIQQVLNVGLMNGDRYEKMAKAITERVGVSRNKAMNIVRTETHRNVESGFIDCAKDISGKLGNTGLVYAVTWRTMKDEKVRPQVRRKTSKGWVTSISTNGANHQIMEGKTVRVGDLFDLGGGVTAKAPGQSGVASHDCRCRCFLEYNLLTAEEFARKSVDNGGESGIINIVGLSANGDNINDIPKHEAPKLVNKINFNDQKAVKRMIDNFEKEAILKDIETACVICTNGDVYNCYGINDRVFPDTDLGDKLIGAVVSHNHPIDETEYTFSKDDIKLFETYKLKTLRGCDEKYTYQLSWDKNNSDNMSDFDNNWQDPENYPYADTLRRLSGKNIGCRRWKN